MSKYAGTKTEKNLMEAFAGESEARNKYTYYASAAKKAGFVQMSNIFLETADQEKEHAEIFYNHLSSLAGETIQIDGGYPVDPKYTVIQLLRAAQHNEYEEWQDAYQAFGDVASEEGYMPVATSFYKIAEIEKTHGDRFRELADLMEQGKLFVSDITCKWMCLNCGHVEEGGAAPKICPVCQHDQGYFIRLELAPFTR